MSAKGGRVEGLITIPSGGADIEVTHDGGGPDTATVAAGDYFMTSDGGAGGSLLAAIKTAIDAIMGGGQSTTVSIADGEGDSSALVTIAATGTTLELNTWTSDALRQVLGFVGAQTGALTYTGTNHPKLLWQPGVPVISEFQRGDKGRSIPNIRQQMNAIGDVRSMGGQERHEQAFEWHGVSRKRMRLAGATGVNVNMSLEQFREDALLGGSQAGTYGGKMRYYWDAADDATYYDFYWIGPNVKEFRPVMTSAGLTSYWTIRMETSRAVT